MPPGLKGRRPITVGGWLGEPEVSATMSRGRVRLERDGHGSGVVPVGAGGSRPLRSAHEEVRRAGDSPEHVDVQWRCGDSSWRGIAHTAFERFFCRPSVARFVGGGAMRDRGNERVVAGDAASSGRGPSREVSNRLRPLPIVPALRVLLAVPWRRRARSMLDVVVNRLGGVATDRRGRDDLTLREVSHCQYTICRNVESDCRSS